jgi:S-adenosylmethionine decarboxylase
VTVTDNAANAARGDTDREPFGWHLTVDMVGCRLADISSGEVISMYMVDLVDRVLQMKRHGDLILDHFGHADPKTSGYTAFQLIETSNVWAHFGENHGGLYLDVFSCRWYDPDAVIAYTIATFGGKVLEQRFHQRG